MKPGRRRAANDVPPPSLQAITVIPEASAIRTVGLHRVERTRLAGNSRSDPLEIVPVFLTFLLVVLRDIAEVVALRVIKGTLVLVGLEVPGAEVHTRVVLRCPGVVKKHACLFCPAWSGYSAAKPDCA